MEMTIPLDFEVEEINRIKRGDRHLVVETECTRHQLAKAIAIAFDYYDTKDLNEIFEQYDFKIVNLIE